jgi:hypothetical protein
VTSANKLTVEVEDDNDDDDDDVVVDDDDGDDDNDDSGGGGGGGSLPIVAMTVAHAAARLARSRLRSHSRDSREEAWAIAGFLQYCKTARALECTREHTHYM